MAVGVKIVDLDNALCSVVVGRRLIGDGRPKVRLYIF